MNKLKRITSIALAVLLVFASIPTINVSAAKIKQLFMLEKQLL